MILYGDEFLKARGFRYLESIFSVGGEIEVEVSRRFYEGDKDNKIIRGLGELRRTETWYAGGVA